LDHPGLAQYTQLLGDVGLGLFEERLQVTDTFWLPVQHVQNAKTHGMGQEFDAAAELIVIRCGHEIISIRIHATGNIFNKLNIFCAFIGDKQEV